MSGNRPPGSGDAAFPHNPREVTVEWLGRVLSESGVVVDLAGVEISATTPGFGATGCHARLHPRYERPQPGAPLSLFAKFSSENPSVRASMHALKGYEREVGFYRDVAPLTRLRIPKCYYAAIDAESGYSALLIEDLPAGREGDTIAGCSEADAELMVREAAGFHAQWWSSPLMSQWKWLPGYDGDPAPLSQRYNKAWPLFREKYAALIPAEAPAIVEQALARVPEVFASAFALPCDPHARGHRPGQRPLRSARRTPGCL